MINKSSTFISGVLAVGIYIAFILVLIIYFNTRDVKKPIHFVKKNEDRIRISMSSPTDKPKKKTNKIVKKADSPKKPIVKPKPKKETVKKKKVIKKKVIKEKIVKKPKKVKKKEVKTQRPKKVNKPKSLFDNIETKKTPPKPKKTQKVPDKPSASELFNDSIKVQKPTDRGIENAYLAMVEEKLNGWPAQSEYAGEKAKVQLKIQTNGSFEFKVISGSSNPDFNIGLEEYLKQLQRLGFGPHKGGRAYKIDVEFIATE